MPRLEPLSLDEVDGLEEVEQTYQRTLGFVPNGLRIMARRPDIVKGFIALRRAVLDPASGTVPAELKNLCAHLASRTHGCMYCQAHALQGAGNSGAEQARLEAVWEYAESDLFSDAEKAALDFSVKAAMVPNGVTDDDFERMKDAVHHLGVVAGKFRRSLDDLDPVVAGYGLNIRAVGGDKDLVDALGIQGRPHGVIDERAAEDGVGVFLGD